MATPNIDEKDTRGTTDNLERAETVEDGRMDSKEALAEAAAKGQGVSGFETMSVWETVKAFKVVSAVCFIVCFSAATDGYQIGINGNIIANPGFVHRFATETNADGDRVLASPVLSAWSSIMSVGQIIGMTTLPFLSDRFGRKAAMYWYWFILAMSVLCESVARTWPVWLVAKILAGVGVGCLQSTIPTYVTEVAPIRIRGSLLMCYNFWFGLGNFFAPVALQVLSKTDKTNYLTPIYTQWAHIGLMLIIYIFVPESPAWLVTRGKHDAAKKSLRRLHSDVKDYDVDHQHALLVRAVEHEIEYARSLSNEKWYAIFKGIDGKRTVISCWTLLAQQFIGLTLFSTFASYFFQQAGLEDPFTATCITTAVQIAVGLVVILISDKVGRRYIACGGTSLAWLSCVAIGILGVVKTNPAVNSLLIFFSCLWNVGIVCNGATGWGYVGEISSQRLRTYTAGFAAATSALAGVVMNVLTPYMVNNNQWGWSLKTGWFYAGVGAPFTLAMWFLIPETKGLSAAEMDELFERKIKPWRFHKTQTATQRAVEGMRKQG
ncbi:sugar transporter [Coniochaeta sp. 2T2.1]|nr:sugar transporter [Coniochaeta sp. 2T2.1]